MKAYLITTGVVFGLLTGVHIWKAIAEGVRTATDPWFIATTLIAASLCVWAWRLLKPSSRS